MANSTQSDKLTTIIVIAVVASICIVSAAQAGTVFTWRDANGVTQFSDTCPAGAACTERRLGVSNQPTDVVPVVAASVDHNMTREQALSNTVTNTEGQAASTHAPSEVNSSGLRKMTLRPSQTNGTATYLFTWGAVNDPNVRGYRIYYALAGADQASTGVSIDVGNQTTYTITGLKSMHRYYFVVMALDAAGQVLGASPAVFATVP